MITPQQEVPQLAKALGLSVPLYLKREDLHPYGSHKGRSIPIMIEQYAKGGATRFAISSSGNAALAALMYINEYNQKFTEGPLNLQIYVGENISDEKYQTLSHFAQKNDLASRDVISITKTDRPKQTVHMLDKRGEAKSLRQSQDPMATIGYHELANELLEIPNLGAIFIPTSSGTTAEGLNEVFKNRVQIHIAQTTHIHPMSEEFDSNFTPSEVSLADAIVDTVALRKDKVSQVIKESGGSGWVIGNDLIRKSIDLLKEYAGLEASANAVLSIASITKATENGWEQTGSIVAIITGR